MPVVLLVIDDYFSNFPELVLKNRTFSFTTAYIIISQTKNNNLKTQVCQLVSVICIYKVLNDIHYPQKSTI